MTAPPPTATSAASPNLRANGESRSDNFLSPRVVAREAVKMLAAKGVEVRPAVVRRLVSGFIAQGHTTTAQLENYLLHYCDPTGETAIRNVMRGAR